MKPRKTSAKSYELSLMMPVYNEEECVEVVVTELLVALSAVTTHFELVILDNGSTDNSAQIIDGLRKRFPDIIRVVRNRHNQKLGTAIDRIITKKLDGRIVGFTCADGEVSAKDTAMLLQQILNDNSIALIKTIRLNRAYGYRRYISKIYNWMVKLLFGVKTRDINGWPVLMRKDVLNKMRILDYPWIIQLQWLYQLKRLKKRFVEVEVQHQQRRGGVSKVKFSTVISFTQEMFSYFFSTRLK